MSPSLLKCDSGEVLSIRDEATGEEETVTPMDVLAIVEEYRGIVQYVIDWERGLFTMSKSDYEAMPKTLMTARRIYNEVKNAIKAHGNQVS